MAKKYYGIWLNGQNTVCDSWAECQKRVKGVPGVEFRGFDLRADAENFRGYSKQSEPAVKAKSPTQISISFLTDKPDIPFEETQELMAKPLRELPSEVIVYTDGSCFNATEGHMPQRAGESYPGGYAAVFLDAQGNELMRINGGEPETTNNRMELTAVKEALQCLHDGNKHKVHIISDSQYVVNSYSKHWTSSWKRAGLKTGDEILWRKSGSLEAVKNQDLFKGIDGFQNGLEVDFTHTKAHVGTKYNELCDKLAKDKSKEMNMAKKAINASRLETVAIQNSAKAIEHDR